MFSTILFVDIRGSSGLAASMAPPAFVQLLHAFYNSVFPIIYESDGFVVDVRGDGMKIVYPPGFAGADHASKAVAAIFRLLRSPTCDADGVPVGLGLAVHSDTIYIGTTTGADVGFEDVTALGDGVNKAALLCQACPSNEAFVTRSCAKAAGLNADAFETRHIAVKGGSEPMAVSVLTANSPSHRDD